MRARVAAMLVCVTITGWTANAQQPQATFRTSVRLIVQAVSVKDGDGTAPAVFRDDSRAPHSRIGHGTG